MDSRCFTTRIERLHPIQDVSITFNRDGMAGLRRLYGLARGAGPVIAPEDRANVAAVLESCSWQQDRNKTVRVGGIRRINHATLCDIAKDVETVTCGQHGASGLMTGRKKRQDDTAAEIIRAVLTEELLDYAKSWDAAIIGKLTEFDGLPAVEFCINLTETDKEIVSIAVDGWSGRMSVDGVWGDRRYSEPSQLRNLIRESLDWALDKETQMA